MPNVFLFSQVLNSTYKVSRSLLQAIQVLPIEDVLKGMSINKLIIILLFSECVVYWNGLDHSLLHFSGFKNDSEKKISAPVVNEFHTCL